MSKKGNKLLGLVLVALLVAAGVYYWQGTQEDHELSAPELSAYSSDDYHILKLPEGWVEEDGFFYSPEAYANREGGPQSLSLSKSTYASFDEHLSESEYANSNGESCVENQVELKLSEYDAVQYTAACAFATPRVTLIETDSGLFEAFNYEAIYPGESELVDEVLDSFIAK